MEIGELNNSADTKMADWIKSVKDVFDQSNGIISEFEKKQEESKEQYKKHYIASFLISEKYRESKQKKELAENPNRTFIFLDSPCSGEIFTKFTELHIIDN